MEENVIIRFLFKLVNISDLHKPIEALKSQMETNPSGTVSYPASANHLNKYISKLS